MNTPKWKKFEQLVAKVQQDLAPAAVVTTNDHVIGKITGVSRQVDISVRQHIGQYEMLILIDCKDLAVPVDVKDVEEVIGLIEDVGAHRGVIVSANGFTSTALIRGSKAGLSLYRLVDCGDHDWKADVALPTLYKCSRLRSYAFTLNGTGFPVSAVNDIQTLAIYDEEQRTLGLLPNLLKREWNQNQLPTEPGHYEGIDFIGKPVKIRYREVYFDVTITASLNIERTLYFGYLPLVGISGFSDETDGSVTARELKTDVMNPVEIEKTWQKVENEEQLAVKPIFTFGVRDNYTLNNNGDVENQ